jgi:hypothetical protein
MADEDKSQFESALNTPLQITQKSGNLRKDLKQDIVQSVSKLRSIFTNLNISGEEQDKKINQLGVELNKANETIRNSKVAGIKGLAVTSRSGVGPDPDGSPRCHLPSSGAARKLYSEVMRINTDKTFKIMVRSRSNLSTEVIKSVVKTNFNPTEMKVGVKSYKSLKDGRVLIETGTSEESNLHTSSIRDKCGDELEVTAPKLRNPRMVIYNIPQDIKVDNLEETIITQNPETGHRETSRQNSSLEPNEKE